MEDTRTNIEQQIERCRRLASVLTDIDVRESLERLAREYEEQLQQSGRRRPFMLGRKGGD